MSRTYNFAQSQKLLHVDPKTFGKWLEKAKIDPETLRDEYDTRQKLLTYEQIVMLADLHKRPRPLLPKEDEPEPPAVTLATLDERLTALEQEITRRLDQLTGHLASLDQRITSTTPGSQVKTVQRPAPTSPPARISPARAQPKKPAKKTKAKQLPKNLVPLSIFKSEHGISNKTVEYAVEHEKLAVERGKWLHNGRNVLIALDAQGRQQFYTLFYERPGFQRCEQCPHAAGAK